jgi:hypothetical protein
LLDGCKGRFGKDGALGYVVKGLVALEVEILVGCIDVLSDSVGRSTKGNVCDCTCAHAELAEGETCVGRQNVSWDGIGEVPNESEDLTDQVLFFVNAAAAASLGLPSSAPTLGAGVESVKVGLEGMPVVADDGGAVPLSAVGVDANAVHIFVENWSTGHAWTC